MYRYDDLDQAFVDERVAEFRDQTRRFLAGQLTEDEFKAVRLRNGLYMQRHAPMLRIAVPYGLLASCQLRKLAEVARRFRAGVVLLFAGSARTRGPFHLTMDTNDAIETAHAFPDATIVPLHYEGWAHFTQSGDDLAASFNALGVGSRLQLLEPGVATAIVSPR